MLGLLPKRLILMRAVWENYGRSMRPPPRVMVGNQQLSRIVVGPEPVASIVSIVGSLSSVVAVILLTVGSSSSKVAPRSTRLD